MKIKRAVKHTPGPWRANGRIIEQFNSVLGIGIRPLASLPQYDEAEANAYLIAAAPDLLEAAKAIYSYGAWANAIGNKSLANSLDKLHDAIVKAEGE